MAILTSIRCVQFVRILLESLHLCSEETLACSFTLSLGLDQSSDVFMGWEVFSLLLIFPEVGALCEALAILELAI